LKILVLPAAILLVVLATACQPLLAPVAQTPATQQQESADTIRLYFTRAGEDPAPTLVYLFNSASDNIDIAVYALTHPDIVKAIGNAHKRGAKVRLITDSDQARGNVQKHAVNDLLTIGVPVKVNNHNGQMHLKMSVIDGRTATLGSYNYTQSASRDNDEVLLVSTQTATVERCRDEFQRMWGSVEFSGAKMSY
jgi:phosphatidylserine/phosphatidylglycerophosphate/cardiolipin synthase-like enzyme